MTISSRTPEGRPNFCPVCGNVVRLEPSVPAGDAPCPHCGCLLWFVVTDVGLLFYEKLGVVGCGPLTPTAPEARIGGTVHDFKPGDRVRIVDGVFANFEAAVVEVNSTTGTALVMTRIHGRDTPVELQVESLELVG
jgi:hypothetical protein